MRQQGPKTSDFVVRHLREQSLSLGRSELFEQVDLVVDLHLVEDGDRRVWLELVQDLCLFLLW